jgi:hypothetical protein
VTSGSLRSRRRSRRRRRWRRRRRLQSKALEEVLKRFRAGGDLHADRMAPRSFEVDFYMPYITDDPRLNSKACRTSTAELT